MRTVCQQLFNILAGLPQQSPTEGDARQRKKAESNLRLLAFQERNLVEGTTTYRKTVSKPALLVTT
jgi:hypothetical protein